jgi:hypothetical protein
MAALIHVTKEIDAENTHLSIKLELYRRAYGSHHVFNRNSPPDEQSIMEKYMNRKKVVKCKSY